MCSSAWKMRLLGVRGPWRKRHGTPRHRRSDPAEAAASLVRSSAPELEALAASPPSWHGERSGGGGRLPGTPAAEAFVAAAAPSRVGGGEPTPSGCGEGLLDHVARWRGAGSDAGRATSASL